VTREAAPSDGADAPDIHGRDPGAFLEEVHSFEFWFQSVEGYLSEHPYGVVAGTRSSDLTASERDALISVLSKYCIGESAAIEGASEMIRFAPNRHAKIFLATQCVDEARHLEILLHRLRELGVDDPENSIESFGHPSLREFRRRLLEFVDARDWEAALFAQNVVLESMEFAVFHAHQQTADPRTAQILEGILKDERRHMGFGENTIGRLLDRKPSTRARLGEIRQELDALVFGTFEESLRAVGQSAAERPEVGRLYLDTVARLGFGA